MSTPARAEGIVKETRNEKMDRIEEKLRLLKPILPARQWSALRTRYVIEDDFKKRAEIENMLDFMITKNLPGLACENIMLPPPTQNELAGNYPVGDVMYMDKPSGMFGVRENEWLRHCGIFGKTGSGKTTLAIRLIRELCKKDKPFLIYD